MRPDDHHITDHHITFGADAHVCSCGQVFTRTADANRHWSIQHFDDDVVTVTDRDAPSQAEIDAAIASIQGVSS